MRAVYGSAEGVLCEVVAREGQRNRLGVVVGVEGKQRHTTVGRIVVRAALSWTKDVAVGILITRVDGRSAVFGACALWHAGSLVLRCCVVVRFPSS